MLCTRQKSCHCVFAFRLPRSVKPIQPLGVSDVARDEHQG
jgi:hypothetical protein